VFLLYLGTMRRILFWVAAILGAYAINAFFSEYHRILWCNARGICN
jgi:uncharacterized membrane protein YeiB